MTGIPRARLASEIVIPSSTAYADVTSTLRAAVTQATDTATMSGNLNGKARSIRVPSGEYGISGPIIATPSFVDFAGAGLGNTVFRCLTRNAQVFLGNAVQLTLGAGITLPQATIAMSTTIATGTNLQPRTTGSVAFIDGVAVVYTGISGANLTGCSLLYPDVDTGLTISAGATVIIPVFQGSRGGHVGNFTVDANGLSHYPCPVFKLVERDLDQVLITGALRDGGMILGTQNCRISRYGGQNSQKCNLRFDASPGNNSGLSFEASAAGEWQVRFRNDIPSLSTFLGPTSNTLEVLQCEVGLAGFTPLGGVDHDAGQNNTLICPLIINQNSAAVAISMSKSTASASSGLEVWGARIQGAGSTAFKLRGATTLYLNGVTDITGPATGFDCDDTTRVIDNGSIRWNSSVTTRFTTTGTKLERDIIRSVRSTPVTFSSDGIALPDTLLYRSAAGQLTTPGDLVVGGSITVGGGIPGGVNVIYASTDSSPLTAQTSIQPDSTLLFTLNANDVYHFEGWLLFNAANTTMDLKIGWSGPAGFTGYWGSIGGTANTNNGWGPATSAVTPVMLTQSATQTFGSAAGDFGYGVSGVFMGDGVHSGTVSLAWCQNTSDAGALIRKKGSMLILTKAQ